MDRANFGGWGAHLSDDEFAKALATIGVHNAYLGSWPTFALASEVAESILSHLEQSPDPVRCKYFTTPPQDWTRFTRVPSPNELAAAWDKLKPRIGRPQLEIKLSDQMRRERDQQGAGWLLDELRRPALDAWSVYLAEPPLVGHPDWQWPIRVGLLNEGARRAYRLSAEAHTTVQNLTREVDPNRDRGTVDLLWITGEINNAVRLLEEAPYPIHAHAVAIVGTGPVADWAATESAKSRITELTQAQSVVVVNTVDAAEWLHTIVRELSHDVPFDVAVNWSGGDVKPVCSGPLLWSARPLIKASRISNFTSNLVKRAHKEFDPDVPLSIDQNVAWSLGLATGPNPTGVVLDRLGERIKDIGFLHESDGASVASAVNLAIKRLGVKKPATRRRPTRYYEPEAPAVPRHLQVAVFNSRWPEQPKAFIRNDKNDLEVHIGPQLEGRLSLPETFPEDRLPPPDESGGHLLTVVLFEPQFMEKPELKTLFLPRSGASLPCRFEIFVTESATEVEARVTVLHENRVLQTGLLRGPVKSLEEIEFYREHSDLAESGFDDNEGERDGGESEPDERKLRQIEFVVAGAVRRAIADLALRSRFDAALVLNHVGERPGLQGTAGNRSGYVWLDDNTVQGARKDIEDALDTGDWDYQEYNGLHAQGTTKLLRLLAIKGNRLYTFVAKNLPSGVIAAKRLQVVVAKDHARFPVEFFYDFNVPKLDAPVCEHAEEALRNGACSKDCRAAKETPAPVVCPLGFWGLSRVLEWHAFTEQQALQLPANVSGRLDIDSAPRSDEVPLGGACLFGYSKQIDKADKDCIHNFKSRVKSLPSPPIAVESWSDWKAAVKKFDPSILMLLVHTKTNEYGTLLEMGPPSPSAAEDESLLLTDHLTQDFVFGPKMTGTPIVLLLGCTTATAKLPFDTVATAFEDRGQAGIVVATSNLIYGPKAVEVAEAFLRKILNVQDGETFGDVTLAVRRSLLAEGLTMILCITVYGDADWKLVKH
ncbi:MAG: hypothetical protein WBY44_29825 [Bryobacteraceae bacterium]